MFVIRTGILVPPAGPGVPFIATYDAKQILDVCRLRRVPIIPAPTVYRGADERCG